MRKLTFENMQEFIKTVVEGVKKHGLGFKSFYIDSCVAMYYGDYTFKSNKAEEIYNNEFPNINFKTIEKDEEQYSEILKAIDECIAYNQNMEFRTNAFSNTDIALADLLDSATVLLEKIGKNTTKSNIKKAFGKLDEFLDIVKNIPTEISNGENKIGITKRGE